MSVLQRLTVLFVLLALISIGGVAVLRNLHQREFDEMFAQVSSERQQLMRDAIELEGRNLRDFVNDYSYWDELVSFVAQPSPEWARINLAPGLVSFDVDDIWVLRPDGTIVYSIARAADDEIPHPFNGENFLPEARRRRFMHFFLRVPTGVFEVRIAPIQPSADIGRKTEPKGWLVSARHWDQPHVATFASVLASEVSLVPPDSGVQQDAPGMITYRQSLKDWDGHTVCLLQAVYRPRLLEVQGDTNDYELLTFLGSSAVGLAVLLAGVAYFVVLPLRQLADSIAGNNVSMLQSLHRFGREFASLAGVVEGFFRQKRDLEQEVDFRRRTEEMVRESESQLRDLTHVRSRLARDLHDGIIQSLYSAGLSIESERRRLSDQAHPAAARLAAVTTGLNQCIREVRTFINSLESEADATPNLKESVPALVRTLQALHPQDFQLQFDPAVADSLNPRQQRHALQIIREAVSNSLRHSGCRNVRVSLLAAPGGCELAVEDDGGGFDLASRRPDGRGLENMHSRAEEAGASIRIDSQIRQGTQVRVRFPIPAQP